MLSFRHFMTMQRNNGLSYPKPMILNSQNIQISDKILNSSQLLGHISNRGLLNVLKLLARGQRSTMAFGSRGLL